MTFHCSGMFIFLFQRIRCVSILIVLNSFQLLSKKSSPYSLTTKTIFQDIISALEQVHPVCSVGTNNVSFVLQVSSDGRTLHMRYFPSKNFFCFDIYVSFFIQYVVLFYNL